MVSVRRLLIIALAAAAVAPASASAAVDYRCVGTAVSGSLLGQTLPTPTAGSLDKPCANASTIPSGAASGPHPSSPRP